MHKSLDYYTPRWAISRVVNKTCNCGRKFTRSDIVQIGIRNINRNGQQSQALAVEVMCPECKRGAVTTFSRHKKTFRQLLCMLLEEMQNIDRVEKSRELEYQGLPNFSKISDKEIKDFKKQLKEMDSYNEFLKKLGIDTE